MGPSQRCCPRPRTRRRSAARRPRRPSRGRRRCSRAWTSRPSTSTRRCGSSRCRAWSERSPRRTGRRSTSLRRTGGTGRISRRADSRSLTTEQQLFDITLDEALAIYAQPKQRGRAAVAAQGAGRRPGVGQAGHRQGRPVRALRHRRRDQRDPTAGRRPRVDHARAGFELLAEKRAKGPTARKRAAKKTTKSAAKKTTAKKTAAARSAGSTATARASARKA